MELSSLVRARCFASLVVLGVVGVAAGVGCHSGAAGGRNMDAAADHTPDLSEKLSPPDVYCAPDAQGGGGFCAVNFCGQPKSVKALQAGEMAVLGADVTCTPGDSCVPDGPASDQALQLRCVHPFVPAASFGAACSKGAGAAMRCKSDTLCIEAPDAPGAPFCSQLCRADRDCPTDAYCLEYKSEKLPNGSYVNLGFCTPKGKITATACTREAQCAADQGCVAYGLRTNLLTCQKGPGAKAMGDACTAPAQCRSGECFDRDFKVNPGARDFCSGHCAKNSDCGADQRCARIVLANNGTPADPFDDVVAGYCQTLFVPVATSGCKGDGDCTAGGADTCDVTHGLCYRAGAVSGAPCTADTGCDLGGVCSTGVRFPGGYCQTFGCAAGQATGVDACPGAKSVCSRRVADEPIYGCYEGCAQAGACSRPNYVCTPPTTTPPSAATLCLFDQGV